MDCPNCFYGDMNRTLHEYFDDFIVVFFDDILIYSKSEEERKSVIAVLF